ncbi:MAG: glutamate--tRNA ligase [Chloroflexi bacterium]|nr:glutamate--tRNA ligase [Chloroflexota bacterium]MCL5074408.1 glutamate--tRNA ligase [Chloroflexota bacterium]
MNNGVRVRIAPSPTGPLHVGRARTALFNWLFTRANDGVFIVRIEDTDRIRSTEENLRSILTSLRWLGLEWDEGPEVGGPYGPYFQMQRLPLYQEFAQRLLRAGAAYYCYCTPDELTAMREAAKRAKMPFRYPGRCRPLTTKQRAAYEAEGRRPVLRFAAPSTGSTAFKDLIRGDITFDNTEIDDLVLVKSDGIPTYNFAVVVDDITMQITHIIRGDDHIANTPKQLLLYKALDASPPDFAHLPMVLGLDRAKLSSRHGATSVMEFAELGYLPEAMVNYLALLGWAFDDKREIFRKEELVQHFRIERVSKTAAAFSIEKLDWMNGYYIRQLSLKELAERALPFWQKAGLVPTDQVPTKTLTYIQKMIPLIQERVKRLGEVVELTDFFFKERLTYDSALLIGKGMTAAMTKLALAETKRVVENLSLFNSETLEIQMRSLAESLGLKTGQLFGAVRVAVTGRTVAPPLFQTIAVLGREKTLDRLTEALRLLDTLPSK